LLREAVHLCGPFRARTISISTHHRALKHDKKSVAGQINWVLLEGVGREIVEGRLISAKSLRLSLRPGYRRAEQKEVHTNAKIK
jgi:hypothetical protein